MYCIQVDISACGIDVSPPLDDDDHSSCLHLYSYHQEQRDRPYMWHDTGQADQASGMIAMACLQGDHEGRALVLPRRIVHLETNDIFRY